MHGTFNSWSSSAVSWFKCLRVQHSLLLVLYVCHWHCPTNSWDWCLSISCSFRDNLFSPSLHFTGWQNGSMPMWTLSTRAIFWASMGAHFLCNCYLRTACKRIFARVAFAICKGHSLSRAKMLSGGQGRPRHAGIYAMLWQQVGGWFCSSLSLGDATGHLTGSGPPQTLRQILDFLLPRCPVLYSSTRPKPSGKWGCRLNCKRPDRQGRLYWVTWLTNSKRDSPDLTQDI